MNKKRLPKNLQKINFNAAGIDIGSTEHYVAVPEDRDERNVRTFKTFTSDLHELARWLKDCKITTVAMESTGVYWITLFQILEENGFEVFLVNAQHVKNVPGRKTDACTEHSRTCERLSMVATTSPVWFVKGIFSASLYNPSTSWVYETEGHVNKILCIAYSAYSKNSNINELKVIKCN